MFRPTTLKTVGPRCSLTKINAAIHRYLLPAPDLSSKPAGRPLLLYVEGQTDRQTGTRPFYDAFRILCGPRNNPKLA